MLSLLAPWNLASYIPFGGFPLSLRDWMLAQTGMTFSRPRWPHEIRGYGAFNASNAVGQGIGFDRLAKFESIATSLDLNDLEIISNTSGHLEFHHSVPFTSSERPFLLFADSMARMFAPFLFDDSVKRRSELEAAAPIYEELLASERCIGILTPSTGMRNKLEAIFPSAAIVGKIFDMPWISGVTEVGEHLRSAAPVFVMVSKPPVCDAFGGVSALSAFDRRCADLLGLASFTAILKTRPDARLIWLCPDWRQNPQSLLMANNSMIGRSEAQNTTGLKTQEMASLIETGAVIIHCQRPGEIELRRILQRADFLIDFSNELDTFLLHQAMENGCIPIIPDTAETRDFVGDNGALRVPVNTDCYRHNPLGFTEGFNTASSALERALEEIPDRIDSIREVLVDGVATKRFRDAMVGFFIARYCRYDLDDFLASRVLSGFLPRDEIRLYSGRRLKRTDFNIWPAPIPELRFEGLELIAAGASIHGKALSPAPETLSRPPMTGLVANRFDSLLQNFAKFKIVAQTPTFGEDVPSGLPIRIVEAEEGAIDRIDGRPVTSTMEIGDLLTVEGWVTISGRRGIIPDEVYVTLSSADGRRAFVKTRRVPRRDLAVHFDQPNLGDAGFTVVIDVRDLPSPLILCIARRTEGRIELCKNLQFAIHRRRIGSAPDSAPSTTLLLSYDSIDEAPSLPEVVTNSYEGNIDALNDNTPNTVGNDVADILRIRGWTTISGKDAIVPDEVFVRIEDPKGKVQYVKARRTDRDDLKSFFDQPNLSEAGFTVNIDCSELEGSYIIGMSRLYDGILERCSGIAFPITVRNTR